MAFDKSKPYGTQFGTPLEGLFIQNEKFYNAGGDEFKLSADGKHKELVARAPKAKAKSTEEELSTELKG
jgi:hypothetical protein